jgi:gamma-glutamyl hercynylcysteine S-oxide hydrolase
MCRHLAYVGGPVTLHDMLFGAPHSLARQARQPRHQAPGTTNADGWGVAWWEPGAEEPRLHRTVTPIWDDRDFEEWSRELRATALVAAARWASPGATIDVTGNAPFVAQGWAFSLNGIVHDFATGVGDELRAQLTPENRAALMGDADTEVLFALVLQHLHAGRAPDDALELVVNDVLARTTGRLNMLLGDGKRLYVTRCGNSLFRRGDALYASEPLDDQSAWREVRDGSVGRLDASGASTRAVREVLR